MAVDDIKKADDKGQYAGIILQEHAETCQPAGFRFHYHDINYFVVCGTSCFSGFSGMGSQDDRLVFGNIY